MWNFFKQKIASRNSNQSEREKPDDKDRESESDEKDASDKRLDALPLHGGEVPVRLEKHGSGWTSIARTSNDMSVDSHQRESYAAPVFSGYDNSCVKVNSSTTPFGPRTVWRAPATTTVVHRHRTVRPGEASGDRHFSTQHSTASRIYDATAVSSANVQGGAVSRPLRHITTTIRWDKPEQRSSEAVGSFTDGTRASTSTQLSSLTGASAERLRAQRGQWPQEKQQSYQSRSVTTVLSCGQTACNTTSNTSVSAAQALSSTTGSGTASRYFLPGFPISEAKFVREVSKTTHAEVPNMHRHAEIKAQQPWNDCDEALLSGCRRGTSMSFPVALEIDNSWNKTTGREANEENEHHKMDVIITNSIPSEENTTNGTSFPADTVSQNNSANVTGVQATELSPSENIPPRSLPSNTPLEGVCYNELFPPSRTSEVSALMTQQQGGTTQARTTYVRVFPAGVTTGSPSTHGSMLAPVTRLEHRPIESISPRHYQSTEALYCRPQQRLLEISNMNMGYVHSPPGSVPPSSTLVVERYRQAPSNSQSCYARPASSYVRPACLVRSPVYHHARYQQQPGDKKTAQLASSCGFSVPVVPYSAVYVNQIPARYPAGQATDSWQHMAGPVLPTILPNREAIGSAAAVFTTPVPRVNYLSQQSPQTEHTNNDTPNSVAELSKIPPPTPSEPEKREVKTVDLTVAETNPDDPSVESRMSSTGLDMRKALSRYAIKRSADRTSKQQEISRPKLKKRSIVLQTSETGGQGDTSELPKSTGESKQRIKHVGSRRTGHHKERKRQSVGYPPLAPKLNPAIETADAGDQEEKQQSGSAKRQPVVLRKEYSSIPKVSTPHVLSTRSSSAEVIRVDGATETPRRLCSFDVKRADDTTVIRKEQSVLQTQHLPSFLPLATSKRTENANLSLLDESSSPPGSAASCPVFDKKAKRCFAAEFVPSRASTSWSEPSAAGVDGSSASQKQQSSETLVEEGGVVAVSAMVETTSSATHGLATEATSKESVEASNVTGGVFDAKKEKTNEHSPEGTTGLSTREHSVSEDHSCSTQLTFAEHLTPYSAELLSPATKASTDTTQKHPNLPKPSTSVLDNVLDHLLDLSSQNVVSYPEASFIQKRDKELRKIRTFGWQYASPELHAIYPTLSRFTQQHRCDVQRSHLTTLHGKTLMCQSQLLAQITYGLQPRDVFGLGIPAGESIDMRLNRYTDKRRIQNSVRRFLEHLLLSDTLLESYVRCEKQETSATNEHNGRLNDIASTILLPGSVAERTAVLGHIFTVLWLTTHDGMITPRGDDMEEASLSVDELTTALNDLSLWPPETNQEDRHEIVTAILSSHPDLQHCLALGQPIPQTITQAIFINSLLCCPYNLPDFPSPTVSLIGDSACPSLTDRDLVFAALEVCKAILDVTVTPVAELRREADATMVIQHATSGLESEDHDTSHETESVNASSTSQCGGHTTETARQRANQRLGLLDAHGFTSVGFPPKAFGEQDILLSNILSVEEIQTLTLLRRSVQPSAARRESSCSSVKSSGSPVDTVPDHIMLDVRVITRCLNIIVGLVKHVSHETDWAFVLSPYSPELDLPDIDALLQRCNALYTSHPVSQLLTETAATNISPEAIVVSKSPARSKHVTRTGWENSSPASVTFSVNWKSFLNAPSPETAASSETRHDNDDDPTVTLPRTQRHPLLWGTFVDRGVQTLWSAVAAEGEPMVVATAGNDPSGLLPLDLIPLQACCSLFEALVFGSGCFTAELQSDPPHSMQTVS